MKHIYIDESGSMTSIHTKRWPYFIIALVVVNNVKRIKQRMKRFISTNLEALKKSDAETYGKMFSGEKFIELKGACMQKSLHCAFIEKMCIDDSISVYYIKIENAKLQFGLYENTARAFNFVLKLFLRDLLSQSLLPKDDYILHIDERNQKTGSKYTLEDYLNMEFVLNEPLVKSLKVRYYRSEQNPFIQIADVFSNAYYRHCCAEGADEIYAKTMGKIYHKRYIKAIYKFPKRKMFISR